MLKQQKELLESGVPTTEVHSLPITPEMRHKALYEGMPQFAVAGAKVIPRTIEKQVKPRPEENAVIKKIFAPETTIKDRISDFVEAGKSEAERTLAKDKVIANTLDKLHFIKERLGNRAYRVHRVLTGIKSASFAMFLEHGKLQWKGDVLTSTEKDKGILPFLRSIGPDWKNLLYYVAAKRSEQLTKEGRENLITDADRDAIHKLVGKKSKAGVPWDVLNSKLQGFNNNILDIAVESGLINKEGREMWQQDFYIPFYRVFEKYKLSIVCSV